MEFCALGERNGYKYEKYQDTAYLDIFHLFFIFIQDKESPLLEPRNLRVISADIERRKISLGSSKSGIVILSSDSAGRVALWADA